MEYLSNCINSVVQAKKWVGIKSSLKGPAISHLFFPDDLMLFCQAKENNVRTVMGVLDKFSKVSSQKVNFQKSKVYFASCIPRRTINSLSAIYGMSNTKDLGKYLGIPIIHMRVKKQNFSHIMEKIQNKLSGWKANLLSFVGRATLVKSVTSIIPNYSMHILKFPVNICEKIDRLNINFMWGNTNEKRKVHLVKWEKECRPKAMCGLGIRAVRDNNAAFSSKIAWRTTN